MSQKIRGKLAATLGWVVAVLVLIGGWSIEQIQVQPEDVLQEVIELREDLRLFLEANPDLNVPEGLNHQVSEAW